MIFNNFCIKNGSRFYCLLGQATYSSLSRTLYPNLKLFNTYISVSFKCLKPTPSIITSISMQNHISI